MIGVKNLKVPKKMRKEDKRIYLKLWRLSRFVGSTEYSELVNEVKNKILAVMGI